MVREYLRGAGFNWSSKPRKPAPPRMWHRPPLVTDLEISGLALQPHLALPVKTSADALVDIYERFIAGYLRKRRFHDTHSVDWLRKEAGITSLQARSLFTDPQEGKLRLGLHHNLIQFAALVHYNVESVLQRGPNTFKVTTLPDYYVFGVRDGELVSNQRRDLRVIPVAGLTSKEGDLQLAVRGKGERSESCILDVVADWADTQQRVLGADHLGLITALRVLWWRGTRHSFESIRALMFKSTSAEAWAKALAEASRHRSFEDPLDSLGQIMAPEFMNMRKFRSLFSQSHARGVKPSEATHGRWDETLMRLEAGFEDLAG